MKKYIAILSLMSLSIFSSCTIDEIDTYGETNYVSFVKKMTDTTRFSFFFFAEDDVQYPLQVKLVGQYLAEDTEFYLEVDDAKTTLNRSLFEIPERFTFRAGQLLDTIYIRIKNNDDLLINKYVLQLNIMDGKNISSSKGPYGTAVVLVSDQTERPEWWTLIRPQGPEGPTDIGSIEWLYLGPFSREKYEAFIEATGVYDLTGKTLDEIRSYSLQFLHWLKEQDPPRKEANGVEITIPVIG